MNLTRRGFLSALAAAAAALGLPGTVAKAETACADHARTCVTDQPYGITPGDDTDLVLGYINRGEKIPPGEYTISRTIHTSKSIVGSGADVTTLKRAPGFDGATIVVEQAEANARYGDLSIAYTPPPLTFEVMQADCAERGCLGLTREPFWNAVYRVAGVQYGHGKHAFVMQGEQDLAMLDEWRMSLHESGG